jgi:hypothetical protein
MVNNLGKGLEMGDRKAKIFLENDYYFPDGK